MAIQKQYALHIEDNPPWEEYQLIDDKICFLWLRQATVHDSFVQGVKRTFHIRV